MIAEGWLVKFRCGYYTKAVSHILQSVLVVILLANIGTTHALSGYIFARTIIKSVEGNRYWAEYDDKGVITSEPREAKGSLAEDQVVLVSAESYKNDVRLWDKLHADVEAYNAALPEGATERGEPKIVKRSELGETQFHLLGTDADHPEQPGASFPFSETLLLEDTGFVILKAPSIEQGNVWQYPTNDIEQILLAQMAFDPREPEVALDDEKTTSLLLSRETGKSALKSENTIAFYSAFLDLAKDQGNSEESWRRNKYTWNMAEDKVPGPINGATLYTMNMDVHTVATYSNPAGQYLLETGKGPPCNIMEGVQNFVTALLYTSSFNPRRSSGPLPYYLQKPWSMPCSGWFTFSPGTTLVEQMVNVNVEAINATLAYPLLQVDFAVDMLGVAGKATVQNKVQGIKLDNFHSTPGSAVTLHGWAPEVDMTAEDTVYAVTEDMKTLFEKRSDDDEKRTRELQNRFDYDGDGSYDAVKRGRTVCIKRKGSAANTEQGEDPLKIIAGPVKPGDDNRCQSGYEKGFQTTELDEIADKDLQQGVYFANADTTEGNCAIGTSTCAYPSVVKLLDDLMVSTDQGLLKSLKLEDLRNTDVYVFRESTGELIAERTGLRKDEYKENCEESNAETGACNNFKDGNPHFYYRMEMRGMQESASRISSQYTRRDDDGNVQTLDESFKRWQTKSGMNPAFYQRESNHLKPGEPIKVIAINRATGYLGSVRTVINNNGTNMAMPLPEIVMGPPNLKVWARHSYKVKEGATKGEVRQYLIGNEGGAKTDDTTVEVYTEWMDQDGTPLPSGLKDFGYTGRIARISAPNKLEAATGSSEELDAMAQFPVEPGRHLQAIKVEGGQSQHVYVQVNGEPITRLVDFGSTKTELNERVGDHKPDFETLMKGEGLLQYRPKHYVPILTPIFNEQDTLAQQQLVLENSEATLRDQEGIYQWRYRPEYQVSVYDLLVKEIKQYQRKSDSTLDVGKNILTAESPMITNADALIEWVYDLKSFAADPLAMFSSKAKELVFAFGEEEISVKFNANGVLAMDNLAQLEKLRSEDFLTMRLYQNNDVANSLWEFAIQYSGFHVYYALPTPETEVKPDADGLTEADKALSPKPAAYRTLGGVRLKLEYAPEAGEKIVGDWQWDLPADNDQQGCFKDFKVADSSGQLIKAKACDKTMDQDINDNRIRLYWQPDWSNGNELLTTLTVNIRKADGTMDTGRAVKLRFARRELTAQGDVMQGSDVVMLEQMLWQLGLSPQFSDMGSNGTRLGEWSAGLGDYVGGKQGTSAREKYSAGVTGSGHQGALEKMVRRFQGRNAATCDTNKGVCPDDYSGVSSLNSGNVGTVTLKKLAEVWGDYSRAYFTHEGIAVITAPEISWSNAAVNIWTGVTEAGIPATYTDARHVEMLTAINNEATGNRGVLLDAWIRQESSNKFWGQGSPATPYREFEGSADEFASLGYSQIKYAYRYGAAILRSPCSALGAYNLYEPQGNIEAMVAFSATTGCGSGGGFKKAFATDGAWRIIQASDANLKGYKIEGHTSFHAITASRVDDAYELLAKAIGSYNGGTGTGSTWANMLKAKNPGLKGKNPVMGVAHANKTYAIQVLRRFGAPARTYVWKGGQSWCFAFGELQWMQGKTFEVVEEAAKGDVLAVPPKAPIGRLDCSNGNAL
jgi:hypothetical protein